jgi:hypothetical protein
MGFVTCTKRTWEQTSIYARIDRQRVDISYGRWLIELEVVSKSTFTYILRDSAASKGCSI